MKGLTVRGKMVARDILVSICLIILLFCIPFAPLISISQTENFLGNDIKVYANISLVEWISGGEVDFYISAAENKIGGSKEKIKYATIDIEEDLKDPDLVYENSKLSEEEQRMKAIEVKSFQETGSVWIQIMLIVFMLIMVLSTFLANKRTNNIVAKLEKDGADAEKIAKAKKDVYLNENFKAGPYRVISEDVLSSLIIMIFAMYVLLNMKNECAVDGLNFGFTWLGYVIMVISLIPVFVNDLLSKSIVNDVEKYNISNPVAVKSMPIFGSNSAFDFNAGTVVSGANYNVNMSNFSSNNEIGNAKSISEYKKLLDEGAITQEEYDKLKEKILFKE